MPPVKRLLTALLGLAIVALAIALIRQPSPRHITVMLPDSAGLFVGNDVGVLGVPIGRVVSLDPDGDAVKARLEITNADIELPADAGAAVVTRSIAADRYIELTPVYSGGRTLADGAVIPMRRTATPVDFDKALASMTKLGDDLTSNPAVSTNLRDLINVSATTLTGNGKAMHDAATGLSSALGEVNAQRNTLVGTVRSMTALATALNANESTVRAFVGNLAGAADLLANERNSIGAALTSLSASIDDVSSLARRHRTALTRDVKGLTKTLRNTVASQRDVEEALDTLPLLGQNLERAAPSGRIRLQLDPAALTPLGPYVEELCSNLGSVCNSLALTLNPTTLTSIVLGLLHGGGI
jgi:phospholipid/cholesterol/gamma-HCH transport system substrate-binding protein